MGFIEKIGDRIRRFEATGFDVVGVAVVAEITVVFGRAVTSQAPVGFPHDAFFGKGLVRAFGEFLASVRGSPPGVFGQLLRCEFAHDAFEGIGRTANLFAPQPLFHGVGDPASVADGFDRLAEEADGIAPAEDRIVGGPQAVLIDLDPAGGRLDAEATDLVRMGRRGVRLLRLAAFRLLFGIGDLSETQADRIEVLTPFFERDVLADPLAQFDLNAGAADQFDLGVQHPPRQLFLRHGIAQHSPGFLVVVEDRNVQPRAAQVTGGRQAGRTGSDHRHAFPCVGGVQRLLGCREPGVVRNRQVRRMTADMHDGDRLVDLAPPTTAFTGCTANPFENTGQRNPLAEEHGRLPGPSAPQQTDHFRDGDRRRAGQFAGCLAIAGMIAHDQFQKRPALFREHFVLRLDVHARSGGDGAARESLPGGFILHRAEHAGRKARLAFQMAKGGDIETGSAGGFEHAGPFGHLDGLAVDENGNGWGVRGFRRFDHR